MVLKGLSEDCVYHLSKMKGWVKKGFGYTKIKRELEELGYKAWRKTIVLEDIRILGGAAKQEGIIKFYKRKDVLPEKLYLETQKVMDTKFQTVVRAKGYDEDVFKATGKKEIYERHTTVAHGDVHTREEIEEQARKDLLDESPKFKIVEIAPVEARLSAPWW